MGASADQIAVSYDVSNDFFRLWLDESMTYTAALYQGDETLEAAQRRKHAWFHDNCHVAAGSRVLDMGCGWGANLEALAARGVRAAHGVTLSRAQRDEVLRRELPGVTVGYQSFLDYRPDEPFDTVLSIGMLEHTRTPEQAQSGDGLAPIRAFFELAHAFAKPGAWFGVQSITQDRLPRRAADARELSWITRTIFPGSQVPRLEEIVVSAAPWWEIVKLRTGREDYQRTLAHWRERLRHHEREIRARFGDSLYLDYDRYLTGSIAAFGERHLSLCRFALKRCDEVPARRLSAAGGVP